MLTPPYHFAIVAAPLGTDADQSQILYRGSIPAARNAPFLARLGIKTLVCLRKKAPKEDDPLSSWTKRRGIELQWIKADRMGEEALGMERAEVSEVLKTLLNPAAYPIYLADIDGNSHTTLIIACLRKLQGWDADSIVNEIYRFEPDHDDLPLVPFLTSYLSTSPSKDDTGPALALPPPPYPSWLWPATTFGSTAQSSKGTTPVATTRSERAASGASVSSNGSVSLPFPNPLTARRHPSMRLTFAPVPPTPLPPPQPKSGLWRSTSNAPLQRIATTDKPRPASPRLTGDDSPTSVTPSEAPRAPQHKVSFHEGEPQVNTAVGSSALRWGEVEQASPEDIRSPLPYGDDNESAVSDEKEDSGDEDNEEGEGDEEDMSEEEEDEDEDEEEEEDEEDEETPMSQYISALDLAGY